MPDFRINPRIWYSLRTLRIMGFDGETLEKACDKGDLQHTERAGDLLIKGEWMIAWLESGSRGRSARKPTGH